MLEIKINAFTSTQAFTAATVGYNQKKERDRERNCTRIK